MGPSNTEHGCPDPRGYRCGWCEAVWLLLTTRAIGSTPSLRSLPVALVTLDDEIAWKDVHYNEFHLTSFHALTVSMIASSRAHFNDLESLIRGYL
jgi:hypothetical protein